VDIVFVTPNITLETTTITTMSRRNSSVVAIDPEQAHRLSMSVPDIKQVVHDASKATRSEQNMSLKQGLKLYPKAVAWSVLLSACIIMEGFDKCVLPFSLVQE
jgi:SP family general alpha glucoside:H+ symporter-like MFS transporter